MFGCWRRGRRLDLAQEPLGAQRGGELRAQDLDGDAPVVPEVVGEVHRRHAARAELSLDAIVVSERSAQFRAWISHRAR